MDLRVQLHLIHGLLIHYLIDLSRLTLWINLADFINLKNMITQGTTVVRVG
jgi:hypothetical protein